MKCQVDAIQWGGGVVAEFLVFRGLQKPTRFSGGGDSSRIFSWSPKADAIQWGGGVVAEFFHGLQKPTRFSGGGGEVAEFFRGLHEFSVNGALLHFRVSQTGGGPGPPCPPPLNRPLPSIHHRIC